MNAQREIVKTWDLAATMGEIGEFENFCAFENELPAILPGLMN